LQKAAALKKRAAAFSLRQKNCNHLHKPHILTGPLLQEKINASRHRRIWQVLLCGVAMIYACIPPANLEKQGQKPLTVSM